jgi:pimeloyl-ACP methyl ester carboxylesterase
MDDAGARAYIERLTSQSRVHRTVHNGAAMVWHEWGEGPPLILLHGGSGSWTHWIHTVPAFCQSRRVIAGDIPGLGDSDLPDGRHSAESLAAAISAGIDELLPNEESFDLTGFSFGGILGGHIAIAQARRIRSLTVVGSPPYGLGSTGPANAVVPVDPGLSLDDARPLHEKNLGLLMVASLDSMDAVGMRLHHDNLCRARLRSRKIARTDTLAQALGKVGCTLNGVWGEADVTIHPDLAAIRELFTSHPHAGRFEIIPDAGHWVAFEAADVFNATLAGILDSD